MYLADLVSPGQIWAPVVSAVLVALIGGLFTYLTTRGKSNQATRSASEAKVSAGLAEDYALALAAKNEVIESLKERAEALEQRIKDLEDDKAKVSGRCQDLEDRLEELTEALRSASLLERGLMRQPILPSETDS